MFLLVFIGSIGIDNMITQAFSQIDVGQLCMSDMFRHICVCSYSYSRAQQQQRRFHFGFIIARAQYKRARTRERERKRRSKKNHDSRDESRSIRAPIKFISARVRERLNCEGDKDESIHICTEEEARRAGGGESKDIGGSNEKLTSHVEQKHRERGDCISSSSARGVNRSGKRRRRRRRRRGRGKAAEKLSAVADQRCCSCARASFYISQRSKMCVRTSSRLPRVHRVMFMMPLHLRHASRRSRRRHHCADDVLYILYTKMICVAGLTVQTSPRRRRGGNDDCRVSFRVHQRNIYSQTEVGTLWETIKLSTHFQRSLSSHQFIHENRSFLERKKVYRCVCVNKERILSGCFPEKSRDDSQEIPQCVISRVFSMNTPAALDVYTRACTDYIPERVQREYSFIELLFSLGTSACMQYFLKNVHGRLRQSERGLFRTTNNGRWLIDFSSNSLARSRALTADADKRSRARSSGTLSCIGAELSGRNIGGQPHAEMYARERRRTISRACTNSRPLESRTDSRNAHQLKITRESAISCRVNKNTLLHRYSISSSSSITGSPKASVATNCLLNQIKHARQGPRERRGGQLCCRSNMRGAFSAGVNMSKVERERERETIVITELTDLDTATISRRCCCCSCASLDRSFREQESIRERAARADSIRVQCTRASLCAWKINNNIMHLTCSFARVRRESWDAHCITIVLCCQVPPPPPLLLLLLMVMLPLLFVYFENSTVCAAARVCA
ncbi:unnamed protein product, partial [Trichogramma brassicae]